MARKRSAGEGSVRRRENGTWRGEIMDGYTPDGKRNIVRFSGNTKGEVLDQIREFRNGQALGLSIRKDMTLAQWADIWYEDYRSQVQPSTYAGYQYTLKIIKEQLGMELLHELLPIQVNRMMDWLVQKGYSMSAVSKCRAMLIQILDAAENNGLIANNPARKAKIIRDPTGELARPRYKKDVFSESEIQTIKDEHKNDLMGNSICLLLHTGLRVQELIALSPNDITEDGATIQVNKAIKMVKGVPTLGKTKSKSGERFVPVPVSARKYAVYLKTHGGNELIWSAPGKNPYYGVGSFRRRYYTALKDMDGVRLLPPHCCRHTYVSRLEAKGVPMEQIARLVGHSKITTTDTYLHIRTVVLRDAVEVLDDGGIE